MSQNLSSVAVVIGALRVKRQPLVFEPQIDGTDSPVYIRMCNLAERKNAKFHLFSIVLLQNIILYTPYADCIVRFY